MDVTAVTGLDGSRDGLSRVLVAGPVGSHTCGVAKCFKHLVYGCRDAVHWTLRQPQQENFVRRRLVMA